MICCPNQSCGSPTTSSAEKRLPVTRPAARPTASASAAPPVSTKQWAAASAARLAIRSLQPGSLAVRGLRTTGRCHSPTRS
eukprot:13627151-Alexandrium_andersonii.AAC.1